MGRNVFPSTFTSPAAILSLSALMTPPFMPLHNLSPSSASLRAHTVLPTMTVLPPLYVGIISLCPDSSLICLSPLNVERGVLPHNQCHRYAVFGNILPP